MKEDKIQQALELCRAVDSVIIPPTPDQIDLDKDYAAFKKLMTTNHGQWKSGKKQHFEFPFDTESLLADFIAGE